MNFHNIYSILDIQYPVLELLPQIGKSIEVRHKCKTKWFSGGDYEVMGLYKNGRCLVKYFKYDTNYWEVLDNPFNFNDSELDCIKKVMMEYLETNNVSRVSKSRQKLIDIVEE